MAVLPPMHLSSSAPFERTFEQRARRDVVLTELDAARPLFKKRVPTGRGIRVPGSVALLSSSVTHAREAAVGDVFKANNKLSLTLAPAPPSSSMLSDAALLRQRSMLQRAERSERPTKKRGAHAHPPLKSELPPWVPRWPQKTALAADTFDRRHRYHWDGAEGLYVALGRDSTHIAKQEAIDITLMELRMNRFHVPSTLDGVKTYEQRTRKAKAKKPWKLEESIWAPRAKTCDSKDFWDSDECEKKLFESDWERCVASGLGRFILRVDDSAGAEGDAVGDEVHEVHDVLWEFHDLVNAIFDYYAAMGASDDLTHMGPNAFAQFSNDCQLTDKASQHCKPTHFDQLFIAVDASSNGGEKTNEMYNRKKALNRQEFMHCLVRIACMRYVLSGSVIDVSDAVHRMFVADIEPRLDTKIFAEPNEFRSIYCYQEATDDVLRKYEKSLRLLYERLAKFDGQSAGQTGAKKLVSFAAWKEFCHLCELLGPDVTDRDVTLAFVASRMRVMDEQKDRSRIALTHLSFEDFLEGLCRLACRKAFPTPEEITALGDDEVVTAGVYLLRLRRDEPEANGELLRARSRPWGAEPLQPFHICCENLCTLLIATCQQGRGDGKGPLGEKEVLSFLPINGGG